MKTISAKILCNELDIPTLIVNSSFEGRILDFIQSLEFECVILIDEAEKTFTKDDDEVLLKLIDGVYNKSRKLYILTTNRLTVNENLIGRPGRIRYIQEFGNLSAKVVSEYIDDNLIDKSKKSEILETVDLLEISTIDIIKSIVEEVNLIGSIDEETPLNIPKARYVFDVLCLSGLNESHIPLVEQLISINKPKEKSLIEWLDSSDVIKSKDGNITNEESNKSKNSEEIVQYQLEDFFAECTESYVTKMTSSNSVLWRGSETSLGTIVKEANEGWFVAKTRYEGEILCLILRKRGNPSLYRGGLL